jgi:hypothetical protein
MSTVPAERPLTDADELMRLEDDGGSWVDEHDAIPPRQCGRCRQLFAGDPTLHPTPFPDWWLCPPCRTALLGDRWGGRRATKADAP